MDRRRAGAEAVAGRARCAGGKGVIGGWLPHRRQSGIARVHRAGGAGSDPGPEAGRSGVRRCRQKPRCADCAEVARGLEARMPGTADTVTQDRQRLELSALSAPAVAFTVGLIAFPLAYTIWLSFQSFSSTGKQSFAGVANYAKLVTDNEFWHGLGVTIALYVLSLILQLVLGVWLALVLFHAKRLPGIVRSLFI